MLLDFAFSTARRSLMLFSGLTIPPPSMTARVIIREIFEKSVPLALSFMPF
jgi:hypothetical protein